MVMRVVVPTITALVMIVVGAFWMFTMLLGTNGYSSSKGGTIKAGNLVLVIITIVVSSLGSGLMAHMVQTRSGMSPWLVAPLTVVVVTVVAVIALFIIGGVIITSVVDAMR